MASLSDSWSLYPYSPAKPAPIVFAVLLSALGVTQIYQSFIKYRWKKFGGVMTWATLVWIGGFILRSISVWSPRNINLFIAQFVLILMGPPLYAAAEYFILGALLAYLPYHAPIHPGRVLSTFLILSSVVESLTASGAANSAGRNNSPADIRRGLNCLRAALIIQCCIEALFFSLVVILERRCRRAGNFPRQIRPVFLILYTTSGMMLLRCIIRTIEAFEAGSCSEPYCGYISQHEWVLWVFEIANITLFVILLAIFHPGKYLPRSRKVYLDPYDGKTERLGPGFGKADKRPLWQTVLDPFNFQSILTGKGMSIDKFWEADCPVHDRGKQSEPEVAVVAT